MKRVVLAISIAIPKLFLTGETISSTELLGVIRDKNRAFILGEVGTQEPCHWAPPSLLIP